MVRYALPNALIPFITVVGFQLAYLLGGTVVIEEIFALPGMGRLALQAIFQRDYPVVQGVVLVVALLFVLTNLLVDVLYAWLDPRIHYGQGHLAPLPARSHRMAVVDEAVGGQTCRPG